LSAYNLALTLFRQLAQSCKDIRTKALNVLRDMSAELLDMAEAEGTTESRKKIVSVCSVLNDTPEVGSLLWNNETSDLVVID
jgi:hypothetical protein